MGLTGDSLALQMQLAQPLLNGLGQFLGAVASCRTGLLLLNRKLSVAAAVLEALDPGAAREPFQAQPKAQHAVRSAQH